MLQGHPTGFECGSRSYDVIDQQDMLATQGLDIPDGKDILHIVQSLLAVFEGLRLGIAYPDQIADHHRTREGIGYAVTQHLALVVAATTLFATMQGDRNDDIDGIEQVGGSQMKPQTLTHHYSKLFIALIFYLMKHLLRSALLAEDIQGGSILYWYASPQATLNEIVLSKGGGDLGQVKQTGRTYLMLAFHKRHSADAASPREEEPYEVA